MGWGQQEIRAFRELVDAGCTDEQIAEDMDLSLAAIATLRRKAFPAVLQPNQSVPLLPVRSKGGAPSDWSDERVDRLKKLVAEGWTSAAIAADLGGVTRNAVIGKIGRLGLGGSVLVPRNAIIHKKTLPVPKPPAPPKEPKAAKPVKPKPDPAAQQEVSAFRALPFEERNRRAFTDLAPDGSRGVAIGDLRRTHCVWPLGDMMAVSTHFCGLEKADATYCKHHRLLAYAPRQTTPASSARGSYERERMMRKRADDGEARL